MSIRWGYERLKDFSNPVKKAEATNEWGWWGLFFVVVAMEVIVIGKILGRW